MIISQTPYRVSFAGGGTDLPAFYQQEYGAVLSMATAHHMYVTVHQRFEDSFRIAYSKVETCRRIVDIRHELVREALQICGIRDLLEVTTIGDVPGGTGMGSSSTLTVGLLNAFYAYQGRIVSPHQLAEEACRIEIDVLGKPIGRQDQYAAAVGGLNYIRFNPDDTVEVHPVPCRVEVLDELERRALVIYTDRQRDADQILGKQKEGTSDRMSELRAMRDLAGTMRQSISAGDLDEFADLLHEGWHIKRSMGMGISDSWIDQWYDTARRAGATAGKILGAGGGGFLLLLAPPEHHEAIRDALGRPRERNLQIDRAGSRIIFIGT